MMKRIKSYLILIVAVVVMFALSGCGRTGECEECGQTEKLTKYVTSSGDTEWVCDDCRKMMKLFGY